MKKNLKHLKLSKETLRKLESNTLQEVAGGVNTQAGRVCTVGCPNTRGTCTTFFC
jgi:hypothetical protein